MITKNQYWAVHQWMAYNYKKTGTCESCGLSNLKGKKIHWANISGHYKRARNDWKELCAKCHQEYDGRYKPGYYFAECVECTNMFSISPSRIGTKLFCSKVCYSQARTGKAKNYKFMEAI